MFQLRKERFSRWELSRLNESPVFEVAFKRKEHSTEWSTSDMSLTADNHDGARPTLCTSLKRDRKSGTACIPRGRQICEMTVQLVFDWRRLIQPDRRVRAACCPHSLPLASHEKLGYADLASLAPQHCPSLLPRLLMYSDD